MVNEAGEKFDSVKLHNIWHRRKMVLDLIIEDGGGDRLVKSKRGKLFRAPADEADDLVTKVSVTEEGGESERAGHP